MVSSSPAYSLGNVFIRGRGAGTVAARPGAKRPAVETRTARGLAAAGLGPFFTEPLHDHLQPATGARASFRRNAKVRLLAGSRRPQGRTSRDVRSRRTGLCSGAPLARSDSTARRWPTLTTGDVEHGTIVRTRQPSIEPHQQIALTAENGHALVIDGSEHGRTDQNLATCIALTL